MTFYLDFEKPIVEIEKKIDELKKISATSFSPGKEDKRFNAEISVLEENATLLRTEVYSDLDEWQRVQLSRHPERPYTLDYINSIFSDFIEFAGDRNFSDDHAIVGGFASLEGQTVMVIGHQKGRTTSQKVIRNFGMPKPEGYRKALRLMTMANRLNKPIITFLDTPGAYPGVEAEERGQSEAIAKNIMVMSSLKVPIISVVIGEGGSGGALGIGVCNRLLMLEYSTYSVISPEGCAAILLRDGSKASEIVKYLKITAPYLKQFGIADEVVKESEGGAHRNPNLTSNNLKVALIKNLKELKKLSPDEIREDRYKKIRSIGVYKEN